MVVVPTARTELATPRAPPATRTQTVRTQETTAGVVKEFPHVFLDSGRGQGRGVEESAWFICGDTVEGALQLRL